MSDTSNGMDLLLTKLLPMVIQRLKALEDKVAALEAPKPKRTRKKSSSGSAPAASTNLPSNIGNVIGTEEGQKIARLYEMSTGMKLESLSIETSTDGSCFVVNKEVVSPDVMRNIQDIVANNPAATAIDIAAATNQSVLVVCYVMVTFQLCDFTA